MSYKNRHFALAALGTALTWSLAPACGPATPDGGGDTTSDAGDADDGVSPDDGFSDDDGNFDGDEGLGGSSGGGDPYELPPTPNCGDGVRNPDEACDDGNQDAKDGCFSNCRVVEPGFICPTAGEPCRPFARCGDGIVAFPEQCDGGAEGVTGCSATCKVQVGYACSQVDGQTVCTQTTCGDGIVEGAETCDEGELVATPARAVVPFDGCDTNCQAEPICMFGGCSSSCGDGIVLNEDCDDGNKTNGDGCDSNCKIEPGYTCEQAACATEDGLCILDIPAVFRDFDRGQSDFFVGCGTMTTGVTADALDAQAKPQIRSGFTNFGGVCIQNADSFGRWYRETSDSRTSVGSVRLYETSAGSGTFVNRMFDGTRYKSIDGNPLFFPVDAHCSVDASQCETATIPAEVYDGGWQSAGPALHNFGFTSEVTFWFRYDSTKSATLSFVGDDDVWVYINRRLAVDLGGLHVPEQGSVTIDSTATTKFGNLVNGKFYEIKVFHAERKPTGSSFKLTLAGFNTGRSECTAKCGDGIIGGDEECDDGEANNTGGYNACQPDCTLSGYCGDGIRQEGEECDDRDPSEKRECRGCFVFGVN